MLAVQWDFNPTGSTLIGDLYAIGALVVAALLFIRPDRRAGTLQTRFQAEYVLLFGAPAAAVRTRYLTTARVETGEIRRPALTDRAPAPVGEIVIDDSSLADLSHHQHFLNLLAFGSKKAVERPKPRIRGLLPLEAPSGGPGVVSGENFIGGDEQPDKLLVLLGDQRVVPSQATPTAVQFRVLLGTSDGTVSVWERTSTGIYSAEDQAPSMALGHRVRKPRQLLSWLPREAAADEPVLRNKVLTITALSPDSHGLGGGNQASHTDPAGPGEGCTPVPSGRTTGADALRHPISAPGTA
jgi:hypothetical protein